MSNIYVEKRNGKKELINEDKINEVLEFACSGLQGVSPSEVAMKSKIQFYDGIKSSDIQKVLIKSAADLIEEYQPDYQYVAARLKLFDIRKQVFGTYEPRDFLEHIKEMVLLGKYDSHITSDYSDSEITELGEYIDHDRDLTFSYAAIQQFSSKYLIQDRTKGQLFESPQQATMCIAMCLFSMETNNRLDYVKRFYDAVSTFKLSLPTPINGGVRSPTRQFSSCVLIDSGDNLDSINATASSIVKYASKRAGIGINGGNIRSLGSSIRGGEAAHTGVIGFYKYFEKALKSCSQG